MKIDFSKFKKIECDDKCTTLQHEGGHELKIAHNKLSKEMKDELDKLPMHLAKGGRAKFSQKFDPNVKGSQSVHNPTLQQPVTPRGERHAYAQKLDEQGSKAAKPADSTNTMPGSPTLAKNNYTEPQDQGTYGDEVVLAALHSEAPPMGPRGSPEFHSPPCVNPSCKSFGKPHPNCRCYGGKMGMYGGYAEGGKVEEGFCDVNREHFRDCEFYKNGGMVKQSSDKDQKGVHKSLNTMHPGKSNAKTKEAHEQVLKEIKEMPAPKLKGLAHGGEPDVDGDEIPVNASILESKYTPEDAVAEASATPAPHPSPVPEVAQAEHPQFNMTAPENLQQPVNPNPEVSSPSPDEQQAQVAEDAKPPLQKATEKAGKVSQHLMNEDLMMQKDLDAGAIHPKTYHDLFAEKGTLGKIGTIFGLLVSGAGSGLTHQPNALLGMMDNVIKNDLQAQQHSKENKMNFIKLNQQNYLNKASVQNLGETTLGLHLANAYMQANRAALDHLTQMTKGLPEGSPERMKADQTLALVAQGVDKKNASIASQAAMAEAVRNIAFGNSGAVGGGSNTMAMKSGMLGPEMAKMGEDIEAKRVPGTNSIANRPLTQGDRDQVTAYDVLTQKADDLLKFAKSHKGTLSPKDRALGEQKANEMVNFYNNSLGGALTGYKLPWLEKQIGKNPTSIFQDVLGNNARLEEIKNSNEMRKGTLLKNYGVSYKSQGQQQSGGSEHTSKSGRPMELKNGKWVYKK